MTAVWPGRPFPLGAIWDGSGTNFSIFSEHAEGVELCLFDDTGNEQRVEVTQRRALNWHCYLPDISPGQRYGYRVRGPYAPSEGQRFNPDKLLIDPYAKAIDGVVDWAHDANVLPYVPDGTEEADLELDDEDDAPAMPKSVVIDDAFLWEGDRHPDVPLADTMIYETHVKGFTTWSRTTRPRATISAGCSPSRARTTAPTTAWCRINRATTWTSRAPATHSIPCIRASCG